MHENDLQFFVFAFNSYTIGFLSPTSVVPHLFGTRDWFGGRQFFHASGVERVVWGWYNTLHLFCISLFKVIYLNWRIITLQYCGGFCHTSTWIGHRYTRVPPSWTPSHLPPLPIPLGCPRAPALGALLYASNMHWSSILFMAMYMFQCYSLKSFHPHLLLLSPKVHSLHLHLLCWLTSRIVGTVFLNSIYMH